MKNDYESFSMWKIGVFFSKSSGFQSIVTVKRRRSYPSPSPMVLNAVPATSSPLSLASLVIDDVSSSRAKTFALR